MQELLSKLNKRGSETIVNTPTTNNYASGNCNCGGSTSNILD